MASDSSWDRASTDTPSNQAELSRAAAVDKLIECLQMIEVNAPQHAKTMVLAMKCIRELSVELDQRKQRAAGYFLLLPA